MGKKKTGTNRGTIPNRRYHGGRRPDYIGPRCLRGPEVIPHRSYDPALDGLERSWCCGRIALIACFYVTTGTVRRGLAYATIGGLCGLLAYVIPASMLSKARSVPRIHDITIDTQNPPRFIDIVTLRKKAKARNKIVEDGGATKEGLHRYSTA